MSVEQPTPPTPPKRSGAEVVKENSRALRGSIAAELTRDSDRFSDADKGLIKFHGSYQQEDRDARKSRRAEGLGKHIMFMVRCKIPGGRMTADQYLAIDELAGKYANGTLRITSRQGIQLHGVLKSGLKDTIAGINQCLLTTLGACGDVNRNVMACPAPIADGLHAELQTTAARLAAHFAPRTGAYHEIWLNGVRSQESGVRSQADAATLTPEPEEPIYGKVYLPRKFKMGLVLPEDNCCDVYAHDLGLLAFVEDGQIAGYNLLVGGGMGMTHGNHKTFPFIGRAIGYVPADEVVQGAESVVKLFRDHGNRADRKRARIKYVVHDWGVERFRDVLAGYFGKPVSLPKPVEVRGVDLHLGAHPQGNGKWFYGVQIENGRIKDEGTLKLRSCLRALMTRFRPSVRNTPYQDILLCDLDAAALPEIERTLGDHGVREPERVSNVRRHSLSCPAIPTCGLALSEAERSLPTILDKLEVALRELGLEQEALGVRMTGCPNGCVRPYQSDVGIVGRSGEKYTLFVGGHTHGHRLNFLLRDLVHRDDIVAVLRPVLAKFKQERTPGETFGDYCQRLGAERLQELLPAAESV